MNAAKIDEIGYIQFLIAAQKSFTCNEASRCQLDNVSHDSFIRLLSRQPADTLALWQEVEPFVNRKKGNLVLDDCTLDKPYARCIELVQRHWSGKHQEVVLGINLLTMLWTDGNLALPCDCRLYGEELKEDKPKSKNDSFQDMLKTAKERGFSPEIVCFDSWYSGIDNLKLIRSYNWYFLTRIKCNRQVNPDKKGNVAVETLSPPVEGQIVHLKEFGFVRLFKTVAPNGDGEYWVTNNLEMTAFARQEWARESFSIENYHRGLKQCCAIESCQCRSKAKQHGHILLSLRAFVRLELNRFRTGVSWYEAKLDIVRDAIRAYLACPTINLESTA
jgi:putative transposase